MGSCGSAPRRAARPWLALRLSLDMVFGLASRRSGEAGEAPVLVSLSRNDCLPTVALHPSVGGESGRGVLWHLVNTSFSATSN